MLPLGLSHAALRRILCYPQGWPSKAWITTHTTGQTMLWPCHASFRKDTAVTGAAACSLCIDCTITCHCQSPQGTFWLANKLMSQACSECIVEDTTAAHVIAAMWQMLTPCGPHHQLCNVAQNVQARLCDDDDDVLSQTI